VPFLLKSNITPNQVTIFRLIIGVIPIVYFFSFGSYYFNVVGLLYAIFIIALDIVDGDLARKKNMTSRLGQYLDESSDRIIMYAILGSIFIFNNEGVFGIDWSLIVTLFLISHAFSLTIFPELDKLLKAELSSSKITYEDLWVVLDKSDHKIRVIDKIHISFIDVHRYSLTRLVFTVSYMLLIGIIFNQIPLAFFILTVGSLIRNLVLWFTIFFTYQDKKNNFALINYCKKNI